MLVKRLYNGLLRDKKVILYTNPLTGGYAPVLSFNVEDASSDETAEYLSNKGFALRAGLHCAPTAHEKIGTIQNGTVRFSPSVFNTSDEVDELIKNIKFFKKHKKYY